MADPKQENGKNGQRPLHVKESGTPPELPWWPFPLHHVPGDNQDPHGPGPHPEGPVPLEDIAVDGSNNGRKQADPIVCFHEASVKDTQLPFEGLGFPVEQFRPVGSEPLEQRLPCHDGNRSHKEVKGDIAQAFCFETENGGFVILIFVVLLCVICIGKYGMKTQKKGEKQQHNQVASLYLNPSLLPAASPAQPAAKDRRCGLECPLVSTSSQPFQTAFRWRSTSRWSFAVF